MLHKEEVKVNEPTTEAANEAEGVSWKQEETLRGVEP